MDNRISIYSLGGLTIKADAQVVTGFSSRKMEALLAYLAYTGRLHSREHLAELFWTDSPIETGLANLRVMLSRLRKIFPEALTATRQTVGLADGIVWSDAGELTASLGELLAQWRSSSRLLPTAVGRVESAISLFRGVFLEGIALKEADAFDDWVSQERERIQSLILEASFALAELYQRQNSHENAKRILQNALRIDPLEERTYRQLMQVYWEQGERHAAIELYSQLSQILDEELGSSPSKETGALLKRIKSSETATAMLQNIPLRLPQNSSVFVGRQRELSEITQRLRDENCRLLTILGLGGIGKTRLSIAAARILATDAESFSDGIFFVALEDVSANLLVMSIGAVLGKSGYSIETMSQLTSFLAERKILLILDNFEQLVDEAETLTKLLEAAPNLKIMLTSRERLQLREEWLYDLHGLPCPQSDMLAVLEESEAVQMLHGASKQLGIQLALARDGREIGSLCRLVDGMPLALEMAASLIRDFGLEQLLQRTEASMDILRSNLRNIPQRQMSLRVLFDSVWERLSAAEKAVLVQLSVFTGYISKEAAMAVAGAKLRDLDALQGRLLLREAEIGRYSLHPLVRQYAFEKLAEEPEKLVQSQDNHSQYFTHFLSSRAHLINSHQFRPACDAVELEIENIRSAWLYSARTGSAARLLDMLHPLARYHIFMERNEQGGLLFASVEGEKLPRALQSWLLAYRAMFAQNLRLFASIPPLLEGAEQLARESHDREALCFTILRKVYSLSTIEHNYLQAQEIIKEAFSLAQELKHHEYLVTANYMQGSILSALGRLSEAEEIILNALEMKAQNPKLYADCLWILGMNYFRREQMEAALKMFEQALEFDLSCQFEAHYAHVLIISGSCHMELGRFQEAEQSFMQGLSYYQEVKNFGAIAILHERLGNLNMKMRHTDEGVNYYRLGAEWLAKIGRWEGYIHTMSNLASCFEMEGLADPIAREAYQEAIAVAERENMPHSKAHALRVAGYVELVFEDYPLALKHLREAASIYHQLENNGGTRLVLAGIFRYAMRTNQLELAAWLKTAFLADPDTDDEILGEIHAVELPAYSFEKAPTLFELEAILEKYIPAPSS